MNETYKQALRAAMERLLAAQTALTAACDLAQEAYDALPEADAEGPADEKLLNEIANLEDTLDSVVDSLDSFHVEIN